MFVLNKLQLLLIIQFYRPKVTVLLTFGKIKTYTCVSF